MDRQVEHILEYDRDAAGERFLLFALHMGTDKAIIFTESHLTDPFCSSELTMHLCWGEENGVFRIHSGKNKHRLGDKEKGGYILKFSTS